MPRSYPRTYRFSDRGKVRWRCRVYFPFDEETGTYPIPRYRDYTGQSAAEAYKKGEEARLTHLASPPTTDPSPVFSEWLRDTFIPIQEKLAETGATDWDRFKAMRSRLQRFVIDAKTPNVSKCAVGRARISKLQPHMIGDLLDAMLRDGVAYSPRLEIRNDLSAALRKAERWLPQKPIAVYFSGLSVDKPASAKRPIFDPELIGAVILDDSKPLAERAVCAFQMFTLCRPSEIWALDWNDLDLDNCTGRLGKRVRSSPAGGFAIKPGSKTEDQDSGAGRPLYLLPDLAQMLRSLRKLRMARGRVTPHVFQTAEGNRINNDSFQKRVWPRIKKSLGLPDGPTFYSLKHAGNSYLASKGIDAATRAKLMGHTTERMANRNYRRVPTKEEVDAISIFAGLKKRTKTG